MAKGAGVYCGPYLYLTHRWVAAFSAREDAWAYFLTLPEGAQIQEWDDGHCDVFVRDRA
jgi:hypothetical protein